MRAYDSLASALTTAVVVLIADSALAQSTIRDLGGPVGGSSTYSVEAMDSQGTTVAGWGNGSADTIRHVFVWTATDGFRFIPIPQPFFELYGYGISADGSTVVGFGLIPYQGDFLSTPIKWTQSGGFVALPLSPPGDEFQDPTQGSAFLASRDGSIIVGGQTVFRNNEPVAETVLWVNGAGPTKILESARVGDASDDASVLVGGTLADEAFRWTASTGIQIIAQGREATTVTLDGSVIAGAARNIGVPAFRWTAAEGVQDIGLLPGGTFASPFDISADGSIIVGDADSSSGDRGFVWSARRGMRSLHQVLIDEHGLSLSYLTPLWAKAISDDGNVLSGVGKVVIGASEHTAGWIATLRICDPALDGDSDGTADNDGDALCDVWEINGIDFDGNGTIDFQLSGADPNHKDLYVEIDAMAGLAPTNLDPVAAAFASVPNSLLPTANPDGKPGITLHYDVDEVSLTRTDIAWPADFQAIKTSHFGTPAERSHPASQALLSAKKLAYRYALFANGLISLGTTSGNAEVPGNDFVVSLGKWPTFGGTMDEQNGTFMHEFGHTLGLGHGGPDDDIYFKPNYNSVMNYTWQVPLPQLSPPLPSPGLSAYRRCWQLDYSRRPFAHLNESSLDENTGINGRLRCLVPAGPVPAHLVVENGSVDWDQNLNNSGINVPANVNNVHRGYPSPAGEQLQPAVDWNRIIFRNGLTGGDWAPGIVGDESRVLRELTLEDVDSLASISQADCDANGVGDDDQIETDASVDSDANGILDECEPLRGDIDLDGDIDKIDHELLVAAIGYSAGESEFIDAADLDQDRTVTSADEQIWLPEPTLMTSLIAGCVLLSELRHRRSLR